MTKNLLPKLAVAIAGATLSVGVAIDAIPAQATSYTEWKIEGFFNDYYLSITPPFMTTNIWQDQKYLAILTTVDNLGSSEQGSISSWYFGVNTSSYDGYEYESRGGGLSSSNFVQFDSLNEPKSAKFTDGNFKFEWSNNGTLSFVDSTNSAPREGYDNKDVAHTLTLVRSVPEPSETVGLVGIGVLGLASLLRKKIAYSPRANSSSPSKLVG